MPRKTKIIFITTLTTIIIVVLGIYFYKSSNNSAINNTTDSSYKPFFGGSTTENNTNEDVSSSNTDTTPPVENSIENSVENIPEVNKFTKITDFSIAGATFFQDSRPLPVTETALSGGEIPPDSTPTPKTTTKEKVAQKPAQPKFETVPSIRYVERVTGHIYQMYLDTKAVGKVSNGTIPSIYEAIFDENASGVLYRYLSTDAKTITTFLAVLGSDKGEFLPSDILDVSVSPDKTKFFYLTKSQAGVVGSIRSFKDTKKTQVFNSSLSEWLSQWVGDQKVYLTTKASVSVEGDLFSLNTANGVLSKVFGGVNGLTTLANKDGQLVLYSSSIFGGSKLGVFDVKNHTTKDVGLYSLPEKCVWSTDQITVFCAIPNDMPSNDYPDSWYQGLVSFNDHFVKINSATGEVNSLSDSSGQGGLDATHLFLDKVEGKLFFTNKKDSTLWSLELK